MAAITKPLGGERLGSGKKMNVQMHNYYRSTHNLSTTRKSTMAPGVLYPIWTQIGLNGDVWKINLDAAIRTLPTQAPLFGSFKLQVDIFEIPIRLYQGILHNNPIDIGMKMSQIKLPKILVQSIYQTSEEEGERSSNSISSTCLLKYLGVSGVGILRGEGNGNIFRKFNATPLLAYYDIFKNYYANKQEDDAYVITKGTETTNIPTSGLESASSNANSGGAKSTSWDTGSTFNERPSLVPSTSTFSGTATQDTIRIYIQAPTSGQYTHVKKSDVILLVSDSNNISGAGTKEIGTIESIANNSDGTITNISGGEEDSPQLVFTLKNTNTLGTHSGAFFIFFAIRKGKETIINKLGLLPFPLKNIDEMRNKLLANTVLGSEYVIDSYEMYPYRVNATGVQGTEEQKTGNAGALNGLCVKTYQSDIFNNWLKTELVEGTNGIAEITAIDTSGGEFTIDALNLAQKVYNMLNRIAASGGTYEDWQEVVYTSDVLKKAESPIYCGGMSSEIVFEEIISNSASGDQPLGTLGGRGKQMGKRGGNVVIKVKEPSILMAIASITPRIDYSQGNEWYMTELDSIDDLHKPALDGIGYQDLLGERMAWFDAITEEVDEPTAKYERSKVGKSVAWIDYMTDVDKVYGEFVAGEGQSYMVLNREYAPVWGAIDFIDRVKDFTTYIDPKKFNYAFANANLDAQNFWGAFAFNIECRRVMSAKQIPNL